MAASLEVAPAMRVAAILRVAVAAGLELRSRMMVNFMKPELWQFTYSTTAAAARVTAVTTSL